MEHLQLFASLAAYVRLGRRGRVGVMEQRRQVHAIQIRRRWQSSQRRHSRVEIDRLHEQVGDDAGGEVWRAQDHRDAGACQKLHSVEFSHSANSVRSRLSQEVSSESLRWFGLGTPKLT